MQSERDIPVVGHADIVVAGGGVSGVAAALRAASAGKSVILIENRNHFGHELTSTYRNRAVTNRVDTLQTFLHRQVASQPLIKVYFFAYANGVIKEKGRVAGVVFSGRDGRQAVTAQAVIDATDDARIALAAGATLDSDLEGENIARRIISIDRPEFLALGTRLVPSELGLLGDSIVVHPGLLEFAVALKFGKNTGKALSDAQSATLEKSYLLRKHLEEEGVTFNDFIPSPETWVDKMPIVSTNVRFDEKAALSDPITLSRMVTPKKVEGLVITGRSAGLNLEKNALEKLMEIGRLSGSSAVDVARQSRGINLAKPAAVKPNSKKSQDDVAELLATDVTNQKTVRQAAAAIPVYRKYDVIVVGGGTSGSFAAIAAARKGASVALIEILPNLGGISSNRVNSYYWGVPWKSKSRREVGEMIGLRRSSGEGPMEKIGFSGEDKKHALQQLALKDGVDIFFSTLASGAIVNGANVKGIVFDNSSGRQALLSDVVIDASGRAAIAVAAGAGFTKGRETDGFLNEIEHGPLRDPTDINDISASYMRYTSYSASMNIRESRNVKGEYTVSFHDAITEKQFDDVVARWRSNYDTHLPTSANQSDLAQDWVGILGLWRRPITGSIPYRSLLPAQLENILVAAMSYSTDHDALIGGRMQSDMEHLGQAAGIAAAMASKQKKNVRHIEIKELQSELVREGVLRTRDVNHLSVGDSPSLDELHSQDLWRKERESRFPPDKEGVLMPLEQAISMLGTEKALEAMTTLYLAGKESIPFLTPLLQSGNQLIREETAVLLGLMGERSAIPLLLTFLDERNTRRFEFQLAQASSRPSVPLYWTSVILLGRLKEKSAVPKLIKLLEDAPSPETLVTSMRKGYGSDMYTSTKECPPPLISFILVALGRIGDKSAADAIKPFLKVSMKPQISRENQDSEISWGIKTNAAVALAELGDLSGIPTLIELLGEEQALLKKYAQKQLETIAGKKLGEDPKVWNKWLLEAE